MMHSRSTNNDFWTSEDRSDKGVGMYSYTHTHLPTLCHCVSRCPVGWTGYRCEIAAASVDSSASSGSKSHSPQSPVSKNMHFGSYLLTLCLHPQVPPPSSSQCSCCCYWHCWWSVPSCGTSGECAGEFWFQRLQIQTPFLHLFLTLSAI